MNAQQIAMVIVCLTLPAIGLFAFLRTETIRRGNTGLARRIFTGGLFLSAITFCGNLIFIFVDLYLQSNPSREDNQIVLSILGGAIGFFVLLPAGVYWYRRYAPNNKAVAVGGKILGLAIIGLLLLWGANSLFTSSIAPALAKRAADAEWRAVQVELKDACKGTGIETAAPYDPDRPGLHPIVILDARGKPHDWSRLLPDDWYPSSVAEAELVVCTDNERETVVEKCLYVDEFWGTGQKVPRILVSRSFVVVVARTGETLHSETLNGDTPPVCPARMEGQPASFKVRGSIPSYPELETVLNPFVITAEE